ncbi:MAG: hypothetical protein AUG16_00740 [Thaumarchaeota archaeon 13_1_20CM_2_39_20]|nr:MAG: hypothetical protein AUI59_00900 [Thaumarchaeota archaeon 13_1_40CM_2_39_13_1]OLE41202.1 MAG: hypothetical protein AUG16_00740 [Thaumarchaeota archaeon 13_1_20CM_2_39_20]
MNILAIGAHPDDIELGCGGLLIKSARQGHNVYMYVITRGEASGDPRLRCMELIQSARFIGAKMLWIDNFEDATLSVNSKLINHLEYFIQKVHPDLILTHPIEDYHHDHRAIAKSTLEAARNSQNVLAYEIPLTRDFNPQLFFDISEVKDDKNELVNIFASQKNKNFMDQSGVQALTKFRAQQSRLNSNIEFAESFEVMKLCLNSDFSIFKFPMGDTYPQTKKIITKGIIEYVNDMPYDTHDTKKPIELQGEVPLQFTQEVSNASSPTADDYENPMQLGAEWKAESIVKGIAGEYDVEGHQSIIDGVSSILEATENDLAFCSMEGEKAISAIAKSKAGIILCKKSLKGKIYPRNGSQYIFVDDPKLVFTQFVNKARRDEKRAGVAATAVIDKTAKIGPGCYIGEFVKIGKNCQIGKNATIHARVILEQDCIIGNNCIIQPGATLGFDGFGFERHLSGELEKFPQLKGLRIGNNVEIGANCSIARGSLIDTTIGNGTKMDSLVHIAHNVRIGDYCQLTAGTVIGGSVTIGNSCWTGLNSTIKHKINIGNNVLVAAGATVINDVSDDDIVAGVPAKSIKNKVTTDELFLMVGRPSITVHRRGVVI